MSEPLADAGTDVSCDAILGGRISLRQPRKGHRAGTDAVLLAAAAPADVLGIALDAGAGVGTAGIILAHRCPMLRLGLIENDPAMAALAASNLALNGLTERGRVHAADLFSPASRRAAKLIDGMATLVMTNPPFDDPGRARASPDAGKRRAHVMPEAEASGGGDALSKWVHACIALLAPGGLFTMIHKPEALPHILAALGQRVGAVSLCPVHPRKDKPAHRILLRGKKGSRAPCTISPPLILQEQGRFTPKAEAIHRGEALIEW